eukprot:CAMPEP_0197422934 /NCGR_PEP_ID=MMETSP1170-20131217/18343_1 /TAXON_ID=54406 /ORGANISM="Sarcinochrysis sp, Strain CCMP770" /LENGTH=150 /DNA_ID=CAMNT_0042950311 /DNA_START=142 /DNA_END=597 /DNA_ORIENTATION=+
MTCARLDYAIKAHSTLASIPGTTDTLLGRQAAQRRRREAALTEDDTGALGDNCDDAELTRLVAGLDVLDSRQGTSSTSRSRKGLVKCIDENHVVESTLSRSSSSAATRHVMRTPLLHEARQPAGCTNFSLLLRDASLCGAEDFERKTPAV